MYKEYKKEVLRTLSKFNLTISDNDFIQKKLKRIQLIEESYNLFPPDSYKCFLLLCDNGFFKDMMLFQLGKSERVLEELYCLTGNDNLIEQLEIYLNRIPEALLPIGMCPNGDQICIGVKDEMFGKILLWGHENELEAWKMIGAISSEADINSYYENIELISDSFLDFLSSLKLNDELNEENHDHGDIWLHEDLLKD